MQPTLKKVTALFTSNPSLKIETLSSPSPPFLKVWQQTQPPPHPSRKEGGVHTMTTPTFLCLIVEGVKLKILVSQNLQFDPSDNQAQKSQANQVLNIVDNFPPGAFYSPPRQLSKKKSGRFWPLRGLGLGESLKNGKFVTKIFFR